MKTKILLLLLVSLSLFSCKDKTNELYYNYDCKIVALQDPIDWQNGKFRGRDKRWLIQSKQDTSLYAEYEVYNDSVWYNHKKGDALHFDYIRKDRFFKIKR